MVTIMKSVEATTIRVTSAALPRYGASSSFRNSHNHVARAFKPGRACAIVAISTPSHYLLYSRRRLTTESRDPRRSKTDQGSNRCIDKPQNRFAPGVLRTYRRHNHHDGCGD